MSSHSRTSILGAPLPLYSTRPIALPKPAGGLRCGAAVASAVDVSGAAADEDADLVALEVVDVDDVEVVDAVDEVVDVGDDDEPQPLRAAAPTVMRPGPIRSDRRVFILAILCHNPRHISIGEAGSRG